MFAGLGAEGKAFRSLRLSQPVFDKFSVFCIIRLMPAREIARFLTWTVCLCLLVLGQLLSAPATQALELSPKGDLLAFINWEVQPEPPIEIWQTKPLARIRRIYPTHPCRDLGFSQDGKLVARCGLETDRHDLLVYEPLSGKLLRNLTQQSSFAPDAFSLSADRRSAFFVGFGQERHVYRVELGNGKLSRLGLEHRVFGTPAMSPDGKLMLVAGSGHLEALSTNYKKPRFESSILQTLNSPSICFSADSRFALLRSEMPGSVQIWSLQNQNSWLSWQSDAILSSCIDPQGRLALSDGYRIWIIDLNQRRVPASRLILQPGSSPRIQAIEWLGDRLVINIAQELKLADPKTWQDEQILLPPLARPKQHG